MKAVLLILLPPLLSAGLLGGVVLQNSRHVKPADVEPYHQRCREAIAAVPPAIGNWIGRDEEVPAPAIRLLRPNKILSRAYLEPQFDSAARDRRVSLLIVQCRDSGDMVGHYPPKCYVSSGMTRVAQTRRDWKVGDLVIPGTEYEFMQRSRDQVYRIIVYNFLIVPGKTGIVPDMDAVNVAAADYQQRYYGAAQFQLVFSGSMVADVSRNDRDEIFATIIGANIPVIQTLMGSPTQSVALGAPSGGMQP